MVRFVRLRFSPRFSLSAVTPKTLENSEKKKKLNVHLRETKSAASVKQQPGGHSRNYMTLAENSDRPLSKVLDD